MFIAAGAVIESAGVPMVLVGAKVLSACALTSIIWGTGIDLCAAALVLLTYGVYLKHREDPTSLMQKYFSNTAPQAPKDALWRIVTHRRYTIVNVADQMPGARELSSSQLAQLFESLAQAPLPPNFFTRWPPTPPPPPAHPAHPNTSLAQNLLSIESPFISAYFTQHYLLNVQTPALRLANARHAEPH